MEQLKRYRVVLVFPLLVILIVVLRSLTGDHFKKDAEKLAIRYLSGENIIKEIPQGESASFFVVNILPAGGNSAQPGVGADLVVAAEDILDKGVIKTIRESEKKIVLTSTDHSVSARCLMLLAQKGVKRLYLLAPYNEPESFKYEFRPDTGVVSLSRNP